MFDPIYVKYVAVFVVVWITAGITFKLIRKLSDLVIGLVLIGASGFACWELYNGNISTWSEVFGSSVLLGIGASVVCIPIMPFSSVGGLVDQQKPASNGFATPAAPQITGVQQPQQLETK